MNPSNVYEHYKQVMATLTSLQKHMLRSVPDEIVEDLRAKDLVDVRTLLDPLPPPPASQRGDVVFSDKTRNGYFVLDIDHTSCEITSVTTAAMESLAGISKEFPTLSESWKTWVETFDAYTFWNQESDGFRIVNEFFQHRQSLQDLASMNPVLEVQWSPEPQSYNLRRLHRERVLAQIVAPKTTESDQSNQPMEQLNPPTPPLEIVTQQPERKPRHFLRRLFGTRDHHKKQVRKAQEEPILNSTQVLPYGFDPERYLRMNPDVKAAGQDAVRHYLNYGRHEHRQY
jgi:hypothetical protein